MSNIENDKYYIYLKGISSLIDTGTEIYFIITSNKIQLVSKYYASNHYICYFENEDIRFNKLFLSKKFSESEINVILKDLFYLVFDKFRDEIVRNYIREIFTKSVSKLLKDSVLLSIHQKRFPAERPGDSVLYDNELSNKLDSLNNNVKYYFDNIFEEIQSLKEKAHDHSDYY